MPLTETQRLEGVAGSGGAAAGESRSQEKRELFQGQAMKEGPAQGWVLENACDSQECKQKKRR